MYSKLFLLVAAAVSRADAVDLEKLRLKASAKYINNANIGSDPSLRLLKRETYLETATELVKSVAPDATFRVSDDHYVGTNGVSHVYFHQTVHGVDIDNANFNVNIDKNGHVFSYGNGFFDGELPTTSPKIRRDINLRPVDALDIVRSTLELSIDITSAVDVEPIGNAFETYAVKNITSAERDPEAKLVYLIKSDGELALTWKVQTDVQGSSFSSYVDVDAETAEVIAVLDHVDRWDYEVYPFGLNDPREGNRTLVKDPLDSTASPFGWHTARNSIEDPYITEGNNIAAGAAPQNPGSFHTAKSFNGSFIFPYVPDEVAPFDTYEAAVTQAFYTTNMLHDLYYILGFTPAAGNYQKDNNGEGGLGNDHVQVVLQAGNGINNGAFTQSTDGSRGTLTMYLFDHTNPRRDSSFDNGFLIHEYTHGMSDRLTGGPSVRDCLSVWEPDGMAEGWSDLFAAALTIKPEENRDTATYGFAAWPLNNTNPPTARLRMYSTNMDINDFTYSSANGLTRVHQVGTVWATMLYEVLWNLIGKYGKNDSPRPDFVDGVPTDGKFLTLKLITDAFAIQPCNPSMVQARDAIIDADVALTGGENACEIWTGFVKRGLGAGAIASDPRVDNFDMPEGVC